MLEIQPQVTETTLAFDDHSEVPLNLLHYITADGYTRTEYIVKDTRHGEDMEFSCYRNAVNTYNQVVERLD